VTRPLPAAAGPAATVPGMTLPPDSLPAGQEDLTDTDNLVQRTGNGPTPDDPDVAVPQTPTPDLGEGA
jgi:hypothetical protein